MKDGSECGVGATTQDRQDRKKNREVNWPSDPEIVVFDYGGLNDHLQATHSPDTGNRVGDETPP